MPAYDAQRFDSPAALAAVVLRARDRRRSLSGVAMQIDSAADVTAIPAPSVNQLGLAADEHRRYELKAFDGARRVANPVRNRSRGLSEFSRRRPRKWDCPLGIWER